jgi:hypothetical protein
MMQHLVTFRQCFVSSGAGCALVVVSSAQVVRRSVVMLFCELWHQDVKLVLVLRLI